MSIKRKKVWHERFGNSRVQIVSASTRLVGNRVGCSSGEITLRSRCVRRFVRHIPTLLAPLNAVRSPCSRWDVAKIIFAVGPENTAFATFLSGARRVKRPFLASNCIFKSMRLRCISKRWPTRSVPYCVRDTLKEEGEMRDYLALVLIRLARKATPWGFVDDHLAEAERQQKIQMLWG